MAIASFSGLASGIQWSDMIDQIMSMENTRRLTPITNRIKLQEQRKSAWGEYSSLVAKLRDTSKAFADGSAFGVFKATAPNGAISGRALVSATASETAAAGTYNVEVLSLARAEKVGSVEVADAAAGLGLSGTFHVNGRAVTLASGDSLTALRDKINAANTGTSPSGVTATILSTSATSHRLILTADATGSRGVELVDSDTGVLQSATLGVLSGSTASNASTVEAGWTDSIRYSSRTEVLKDVLGVSPPPAVSNILVNGVQVQIDFNTDTLDSVLTKIQAADPAAKMREEVVNGKTMYRLSTSGTVAADPGSPESQRNLELLGFSKRSAASQISAGADARFQIDGYDLVRRTNTVTDAIQGVTLDLLATDAASRTAAVTGSGLSVANAPKSIDAGTYAIALQDDGMGTITGATVGGVAADWDAATQTIRGRADTAFAGLEIGYSGASTSGSLGSLTVTGDISVDVTIARDTEATEKKVQEFVDLYNKVASFVKQQRDSKGPLGSDGSLRAMYGSLRDVLFKNVTGLSASNPYTLLSLTGVEFTREGTLKLNADTLKEALGKGPADVKELFAGVGAMMKDAANALSDSVDGSIKLHQEAISSSISTLEARELDVEARLERQRAAMVKQYSAMEEAMSKIQSQGSWLMSQIAGLSSS